MPNASIPHEDKFQFLIGRIEITSGKMAYESALEFQFLIGRIEMCSDKHRINGGI